jgi:hypothetical protein
MFFNMISGHYDMYTLGGIRLRGFVVHPEASHLLFLRVFLQDRAVVNQGLGVFH